MNKKSHTITKISFIVLMILAFILLCCFLIISAINRNKTKHILFDAIETNDIKTVEQILEKDSTFANEDLYTSFVVELVLDMIGSSDSTPLLSAIQYGNNDIAYLLVEHGADVNKGLRCYPIIEAITRKNFELVWYLIDHGADVTVVDRTPWKRTVLCEIVATPINNGDMEKADIMLELYKYALEHNAPDDSHVVRPNGIHKLLGIAASQNSFLIVEYMCSEKLYDINETITDDNKTALICAVQKQSYDACKVLLSYNADKTLKDDRNMTAYDYAVQLQDKTLMDLLCE